MTKFINNGLEVSSDESDEEVSDQKQIIEFSVGNLKFTSLIVSFLGHPWF